MDSSFVCEHMKSPFLNPLRSIVTYSRLPWAFGNDADDRGSGAGVIQG